jgi:hypothetical protein
MKKEDLQSAAEKLNKPGAIDFIVSAPKIKLDTNLDIVFSTMKP